MRAASLLLPILLLGAAVPACKTKATATADAGQATEAGATIASTLTPEQAAKVLAKVGDHAITLGEFVASLDHLDQFDRMRYQSPERRKELLTEMINNELLAREAAAKGYDKEPGADQELRALLRDAMLKEARKGGPAPADIAEADVKGYFEAHKDEYRDPERRRISAIVLKDEKTAKETLEAATKATTAPQWGELVRAKSIDPQAKANVPVDLAGDFGMVSPPGDARGDNPRIPEEVRKGAFELTKPGEILPRVIASQGKFFVVRLGQKIDAHERTFQEADRTIRVKLSQEKMKAREDEMLAQLRAKFPVQVDEGVLAAVKVDLADAGAGDASKR